MVSLISQAILIIVISSAAVLVVAWWAKRKRRSSNEPQYELEKLTHCTSCGSLVPEGVHRCAFCGSLQRDQNHPENK